MPSSRFVTLLLLFLSCSLHAAPPTRPVVPGFERFYATDKADLVAGGRLLLGELGCAHCHARDTITAKRPAPILDHVGSRVRASYLKKFLTDPQATKPGTLMPNLLINDSEKEQKVEALVHFLASTGEPRHERIATKSLTLGKDLYTKVGCIACHGTRDGHGKPETVFATSVPMSNLETKYTLPSLAAFLADPLHTRLSGRMPRLLTQPEAKAVAGYLLQGLSMPLVGKGTTKFRYYEGSWEKLPDFAKLTPKATGVVHGFDIALAARESNYALQFECILPVEREGEYTFSLVSDDGSRLLVDGKRIVNNDGLHAPTNASGRVKLTKGIHTIVVEFFQAGGGAELDVLVSHPGQGVGPLADLVAASEEHLKKKPTPRKGEETFVLKPELVGQGEKLFASLGCANCHQLKRDGKAIEAPLKASAMASLVGDRGCLSGTPTKGVPQFGLDAHQRKAIAATLANKSPVTPNVITETMTTFNCYACHVRDKVGGPLAEVDKYFLTVQPEMGDEGRVPPPLDGVGAKLTTEYFKGILERGAHDRPYMHTRMPGFGLSNTGAIVEAFAAVDKLPVIPKVEFKDPAVAVRAKARHLVGGLALGCIKCHTFNGVKAEGVQGIDMTLMPKRLKRDWFHAYIAAPQQVRPGTRMPSAFEKGKSVLPDILDGTATTQIEAMWLYLKEGRMARTPAGMGSVSIPLVPTDGAIIYRNFIEGVGTRAIGVGYPEKAHLAFDANESRLAMIWQGAFIDAAKHWADRGSGWEGPLGDNVLKLPTGPAFAMLENDAAAWPSASPRKLGYRFQGYRLTEEDRPTFLYAFDEITVEDFPNPAMRGKDVILTRTLTLKTTKPIAKLFYRAIVANKIESLGDGVYRVDETWKMKVGEAKVRTSAGKKELLVPVRFTDGKAEIVQEYHW